MKKIHKHVVEKAVKFMMKMIGNMDIKIKIIEEHYLLLKMDILVRNGLLKSLILMIELQLISQILDLGIITIAEIQITAGMFGAIQQILKFYGNTVISVWKGL